MTVKVYSTPLCPWCKKLKAWLAENKVEFEEIDVSNNEAAAHEMIEKSGQMGVPVVDVDGIIITSFDIDALKKALKIK